MASMIVDAGDVEAPRRGKVQELSSGDLEWNRVFVTHHDICSRITTEEFLNNYVPLRKGVAPLSGDFTGIFDDVAKATADNEMTNTFIKGLENIMRAFPDEDRMEFRNTRGYYFPSVSYFSNIDANISTTFPGLKSPDVWLWRDVAFTWQLKLREEDDPVLKDDDTRKYSEAVPGMLERVRMAKHARNLLHEHMACFVFVVGVYGTKMRIYRFSRTTILISQSFDYVQSPQLVCDFLWRLVHPICPNPRPHMLMGGDPTVRRPSVHEFEQLFDRLVRLRKDLEAQKDGIRRNALMITTYIHVDDGKPRQGPKPEDGSPKHAPVPQEAKEFLTFQEMEPSSTLFGRCPRVFMALMPHDHDLHCDRICVIKDGWCKDGEWNEAYFHERILRHAAHPEIREQLRLELNLDLDRRNDSTQTGFVNCLGSYDFSCDDASEEIGFLAMFRRNGWQDSDLVRVRTVLGDVGRPFGQFKNTKELVTAVRDVAVGLRYAKICGVVHRDVSICNALLYDIPGVVGGFLIDLDASCPIVTSLDPSSFPAEVYNFVASGRRGTMPFMAMIVLARDHLADPFAEYCSDLESVFWLLLYCVISYTSWTHTKGDDLSDLFKKLFNMEDAAASLNAKVRFLEEPGEIVVLDNPPLTALLKSFTSMFHCHLPRRLASGASRVHENDVLNALNDALQQPGWPEDDASTLVKPRKDQGKTADEDPPNQPAPEESLNQGVGQPEGDSVEATPQDQRDKDQAQAPAGDEHKSPRLVHDPVEVAAEDGAESESLAAPPAENGETVQLKKRKRSESDLEVSNVVNVEDSKPGDDCETEEEKENFASAVDPQPAPKRLRRSDGNPLGDLCLD